MTANIAKYTPAAPLSPFGSIEGFETCQRMAKALAVSTFIPKAFHNNIGDCLILLETASRTNMPIMALMQNMYVVHGKPSFSSSFMAGLINNSRRFDGPLQFKYNKDRSSCYAYATKDGQEYKSVVVSLDMAKQEGWTSKKGSKWLTMPEVMLQYRAISFFARAYCADLIMGMRSADELQDIPQEDVVERSSVSVDLNEKFSASADDVNEETGEIIEAEKEVVPIPENLRKALENHKSNREKENNEVSKPEQEKPQRVRTRPSKIEKFKEEIQAIDNSLHIDRWRLKHHKRIVRELPKESDHEQVIQYADDRFHELQALEKEQRNEPPVPGDDPSIIDQITCPDTSEEVSTGYCNTNCSKREGCPAHETVEA